MMAKGFVAGIQFEALFQDNLFFELAAHANEMAEKIATELKKCGYSFYVPPCTNQLFPVLPNDLIEKLSEQFLFSIQAKVDKEHSAIRFVTSWATTQKSVDSLREFFARYAAYHKE